MTTDRIACLPELTARDAVPGAPLRRAGKQGFELAQDVRLRVSDLVRARGRVRYLHFHWQHFFYDYVGPTRPGAEAIAWLKVAALAVRLSTARLLGYRLVWTIHQLKPHHVRSARRDRVACMALAATCHALLALDQATAREVERRLRPFAHKLEITPQGPYDSAYPAGRPRGLARQDLGIAASTLTLLAFGSLREDKNLLQLVDAFQAADIEDAALVIAGSAWDEDLARELLARAEHDRRLRVMVGHVRVEQVAELFGAADLAVVARTDGGTSGVMILALSFGLPLLAADLPTARALIRGGRAGWLFEPRSRKGLRETIEQIGARRETVPAKGLAAREAAGELSWETTAARTAEILRRR